MDVFVGDCSSKEPETASILFCGYEGAALAAPLTLSCRHFSLTAAFISFMKGMPLIHQSGDGDEVPKHIGYAPRYFDFKARSVGQ